MERFEYKSKEATLDPSELSLVGHVEEMTENRGLLDSSELLRAMTGINCLLPCLLLLLGRFTACKPSLLCNSKPENDRLPSDPMIWGRGFHQGVSVHIVVQQSGGGISSLSTKTEIGRFGQRL